MMLLQVAVIAPYRYPDLAEMGDIHFLLAQRLLENQEHLECYANSKKYKIMENGAFEIGTSLSVDEVITAAELVKADEVIAPDKPSNPADSFEMTTTFIDDIIDMGKFGDFKIQVVPHGKDLAEYLKYFRKCTRLGPDVIGLSILDLWKWNHRLRPMVVCALEWWGELPASIEYHLLGLDNMLELTVYEGSPLRSLDTSLPISKAWNNQKIGSPELHSRMPKDSDLTDQQMILAEDNINALLDIAHWTGIRGEIR